MATIGVIVLELATASALVGGGAYVTQKIMQTWSAHKTDLMMRGMGYKKSKLGYYYNHEETMRARARALHARRRMRNRAIATPEPVNP